MDTKSFRAARRHYEDILHRIASEFDLSVTEDDFDLLEIVGDHLDELNTPYIKLLVKSVFEHGIDCEDWELLRIELGSSTFCNEYLSRI